jgi:hypothetical protein
VARWEGEFDDERARVFGTPEEVPYELARGEAAFAEATAGVRPDPRRGSARRPVPGSGRAAGLE